MEIGGLEITLNQLLFVVVEKIILMMEFLKIVLNVLILVIIVRKVNQIVHLANNFII